MADAVSFFLDDRAWRELLDYEPLAAEVQLHRTLRAEIASAPSCSELEPVRRQVRVITLTGPQALEFRRWLLLAVSRADAPGGVREALGLLTEAQRRVE